MHNRGGHKPPPPETAKLTQQAFLKWQVPPLHVLEPAELLPPPLARAAAPAALDPFVELSRVLTVAKTRLDDIPEKDFDTLMRAVDLYAGLKRTLRTDYGMTVSTNASLKMYELIVQMRLLVSETGAMRRTRAFCNAEFPGAFIVAINHYVRTMCPQTEFDWLGSSYYPDDAVASGDDTILGDTYGLYAANRDHWLMGPAPNALSPGEGPDATVEDAAAATVEDAAAATVEDAAAATDKDAATGEDPDATGEGPDATDKEAATGEDAAGEEAAATASKYLTGDLMDADVVAALAAAVHARFGTDAVASGASLYTSDAGIDVGGDFNRQEELTALLNYGQVLCGVLALAPGGHLVTKQYTFFTPFSRSLIALLAALFDELYIVKPLTSRPSNSEIYLVGKGFRGVDAALAAALLARLAAYRAAADTTPCDWTPLLDPTLTADVDAAILRVARTLYGRQQVAFLNEAVDFHARWRGRLDQLGRALSRDARRVQEAWLGENPVRRIRDEHQLRSRMR